MLVIISPERVIHLARSIRQLRYLQANSRVASGTPEGVVVLNLLRSQGLVNQPVTAPGKLTLDSLGELKVYQGEMHGPLVTVIMTVYNSADYIKTAIESVLNQTYREIELIVVDDASPDDSMAIVRRLATTDDRIEILSLPVNVGAYAARNRALALARGVFVTVHDADDWSHPKKLEVQVAHLLRNPRVIGNLSESVRVSAGKRNSFEFVPFRGRQFIRPNASSLMFRRAEVVKALGRWDAVRFGADSEFHERMQAVFGAKAVVSLKTGPLAFLRVHAASLTSSGAQSTHSGIKGIRRFYVQRFNAWHADIAAGRAHGFLEEGSANRPFTLPQLMTTKTPKHPIFATLIREDLTNPSVAAKVARAAKPVALVHTGLLTSSETISEELLSLVDFKQVVILFEGDSAKLRKGESLANIKIAPSKRS